MKKISEKEEKDLRDQLDKAKEETRPVWEKKYKRLRFFYHFWRIMAFVLILTLIGLLLKFC